jgi:hypothetical protein
MDRCNGINKKSIASRAYTSVTFCRGRKLRQRMLLFENIQLNLSHQTSKVRKKNKNKKLYYVLQINTLFTGALIQSRIISTYIKYIM